MYVCMSICRGFHIYQVIHIQELHEFLLFCFLANAPQSQQRAIQETKAVFEPLREKLLAAVAGLEQLLVSATNFSPQILFFFGLV